MNRTIDALIAAQLDMDDELGLNAERGAARVTAHNLAQQLVVDGDVPSNERSSLRMTSPR